MQNKNAQASLGWVFLAAIISVNAISAPLLSQAVRSTQRPFDFYGHELKLGEAESSILAGLSKDGFAVVKIKVTGTDSYLVNRPPTNPGGEIAPLGSLDFRDQKLTRASKTWFSGDGSAAEFSTVLQRVFSAVRTSNVTECFMDQGESQSPEGESRSTYFVCGDRKIEILVASVKSPSSTQAQIEEVLEGRK